MLTSKDLLYLALLLANQDGLTPADFTRYGIINFLSRGPADRLEWLVEQGLAYKQIPPGVFTGPKYFVSPAGALAHFHALAVSATLPQPEGETQ